MSIIAALSPTVESLKAEQDQIPPQRKELLQRLATYIQNKKTEGAAVHLNFICTHNSRRSHLAQIWAATAAAHYGIADVHTYSGGTEATAFNPRAVAALQRVGFQIEAGDGENPVYQVTYAEAQPPLECFSKVYDHEVNPEGKFAAIMTCSDADENCPFIPGVELRLALTYDDPKAADDTPEEAQRYDERVRQIGREIFYSMQLVTEA